MSRSFFTDKGTSSGSKDAGSRAKWKGQKEPSGLQAEEHFADAVCAPLVLKADDGERTTLGAIHVYLDAGRFRQSDFDFIIAVANLVVIGLVRARAHTSLERDYERLVSDTPGYDELIGQSTPMLELKEKIKRVGRAPGGVLIVGESERTITFSEKQFSLHVNHYWKNHFNENPRSSRGCFGTEVVSNFSRRSL